MAASEDIETVDAELVGAGSGTDLEPARRTLPPAAVAAGVAVTGVAAGMATVAVVHRRAARKAAKRRRKALGRVVASRSFLLDVHVLGDR
jgi:shikimate kinase